MIYVITGRAGTGKRTLVEFLKSHDIEVMPYVNGETKPMSDKWYITDPLGVEGIIREAPTTPLLVIYPHTEDIKVRKKNFVARYDNELQGHRDFAKQDAAEDLHFTLFEAQSQSVRPFVRYAPIFNDGDNFVQAIMGAILFKSRHDMLMHMLTNAMLDPSLVDICDKEAGTLTLIASDPDTNDTPEPLTPEQIAGISIDREDTYPKIAQLTAGIFRQ